MIPKIIHYCWFGGNPLPKDAKKCIKSWKKYCPDYQILRWDESNFDISACPLYVRQAYEAKQWAFVSDYVRLKLVYDNGGIYVDTDVEFLKAPDSLLNHRAYFGFEDNGQHINTGLGFGAEKGHPILARLLADYADIPFIKDDGSVDEMTCPQRNTAAFLELGLAQNDTFQTLSGDIRILPKEYLCPVGYWHCRDCITKNTISIHWYSASWLDPVYLVEREKKLRKIRYRHRLESFRLLPQRMFRSFLGNDRVDRLKKKLGR